MILIITDEQDAAADAVIRALNRRGAAWLRLNGQDIPRGVELELDPCSLERSALTLARTGRRVPLDVITAVWRWKPRGFALPGDHGVAELEFMDNAWRDTVSALERSLGERALFINPIDAVHAADDKPRQLRVARDVGFVLPPTLISNSPSATRAFCAAHGEVVFKVINRVPVVDRDGAHGAPALVYTSRLAPEDVAALDGITLTPGIFQARVPKRYDLRVTVVGEQVFACEIHSQQHAATQVDFRRTWRDGVALPHLVHALPDEVAGACVELTRRLGLYYGAIDLVLTPDGAYVFLEINPCGMFGWVQQLTRMPISIAIADLLIAGPKRLGHGQSRAVSAA